MSATNPTKDSTLKNRFIIFYTIRFLWKNEKKSVPQLYDTLITNRTLFDNVLALKEIDFISKTKTFYELTNVDAEYWDGQKELQVPGIAKERWDKYITLRYNLRELRLYKDKVGDSAETDNKIDTLTRELDDIEESINRLLAQAKYAPESKLTGAFSDLRYFAENGRKKTTENIETNISEVKERITKYGWKDYNRLSKAVLDEYISLLRNHLEVLTAISIIKKQEESKKSS